MRKKKGALRKAGQRLRIGAKQAGRGLRNMDDAYSAKIGELYTDANPAVQTAAYMVGGAHPSLRKAIPEGMEDGLAKTALEYAIPAANAVPKYVLPAVGVTLAGKALVDLTNGFGGAADQPEQATLPM